MRNLIVGPILEDIIAADFSGQEAFLATAFYSAKTLDSFEVTADRLHVMLRLNISNMQDWIDGIVDPAALLRFIERQEARGTAVSLRRSNNAHAKAYLGRTAFLVGSANFSANGLSGKGQEILWTERQRGALGRARASLRLYAAALRAFSTSELRALVRSNEKKVQAIQRRRPDRATEDKPQIDSRPPRLGSYDDFVSWLGPQTSSAAREIYARAHGKSQLSGHVQNCFYGGRQLLVLDPKFRARLLLQSPETYRVFRDPSAERRIREFTDNEIVDEPGFHVSVWRNISPIELGGVVPKKGGLIGSLNRTLPLLTRYLGEISDR